jgi:hypothetical protein
MSFFDRFLSGRAAINAVDNQWTSDPPDRCTTARKGLARLVEIKNKGGLSVKDAQYLENLAEVLRDHLQKHCR